MNILGFKKETAESFAVNNYYNFNYTGFNMVPHSHYSAELMYIESGECEVFIYLTGNIKEYKKIKLKKGQFILIFSGIKHKLFLPKTKQCRVLNLEFSPTKSNVDIQFIINSELNIFGTFNSSENYIVANDSVNLISCIKKLLNELTSSYPDSKSVYLQTLILELLILVYRCIINSKSDSTYYITKATEYIKNNYSHSISVSEIAQDVGLNTSYLERLFKAQTGKTILAHINSYRLDQAKRLIENTNIPLTDIAFYCGYGTRQSFYESFKKSEGLSPSDFKKNILSAKTKISKQSPYKKR